MPEQQSRRGFRATRCDLPSQSVFRYARCFAIAAGNAALLAGAIAARADGVPGLRGHDHTGITVPDIRQAADFFINVLGCKEAMSFGPFADEKGNFMADLLNVNPRR